MFIVKIIDVRTCWLIMLHLFEDPIPGILEVLLQDIAGVSWIDLISYVLLFLPKKYSYEPILQ